MTQRDLIPASFRGRILLVVLLAAVVPLALVGIWLTRSVVRAGEELLHSELEQSLDQLADGIARRWTYRSGELTLLANNESAQRLISSGGAQRAGAGDSAYLGQLFAALSPGITSFEYRDGRGSVRWSTSALPADTADARGRQVAAADRGATLTRSLPVAAPGAATGTMVARVSVAALTATDTSVRLPNGASLQIVDHDTRHGLLPPVASDSQLAQERFTTAGGDWLALHRSLPEPGVDLILAAPLQAYVQPFENAARAGILTLAIVALLALALSAILTTRLTRSLQQLAVAADAVAGGDLDRRVQGGGDDEVGRVGAAFNTMVENLRRTLGELSRRQALAAVGEYAAALSHAVRNGLTAVRVDLQRAEEKLPADVAGRPLVNRALDNVRRLDGVVSDSLRAARARSAPKRRVDLVPILRSAARGAESAFSERAASLVPLGEAGAPAWVLGDAAALEQLFTNLLINAAQALPSGGRAEIAAHVEDSELCVIVGDTGSGIPAADIERVFEPFYSTKENGTGLGLAIARQVAASHGGSLRITSREGEGTRVEVRLPLAAAPV